jgi:hypothetical protein
MRNALYWLVLLLALAAAGGTVYYKYQDTRPCAHPVAYRIGAIDSRFEISTTTVIAEANTAAAIWNKAAGKAVLAYDADALMTINLIYDEREAAAKLGAAIAREKVYLDSQRERLDALGASNGHDPAINAQIERFNERVRALNARVTEYNATVGHEFEEGHYAKDESGERIEIYEFVDKRQLERVLAHELGHAVGLEHNEDSKSIMYAKNESGNLVPTTADLADLEALCGA